MATNKKDPSKDPSTISSAYEYMAPKWAKIEAVLGGTETMRAAGQIYLPQHYRESNRVYGERLDTNTLFNMSELTLKQLVGKPFSNKITISDDVKDWFKNLIDDIDLQGNSLDIFARKWFEEGLAKGFAHLIVDFPRLRDTQEEEGRERTLEDDRSEGVRPYWVFIKPEDVIFARSEIVQGREFITHLRIKQTVVEPDGFSEVVKHQIKVWEPGLIVIYELRKNTKTKKEEWIEIDSYEYDLDFIPIVTFYADKEGLMEAKPPLLDLINLNITHWQSSSDQRSTLTVTRFPMLASSGALADDGGEIKVGPREHLNIPDPRGKFYYVENAGSGLSSGRQDILDLEEQMSNYGAELLKKRPGNITATERALDSSESTSQLQDIVIRFNDALNLAKLYTAIWMDKEDEDEGLIELPIDFGPSEEDTDHVDVLTAARKNRDISRHDYLEELKIRGFLREEFNEEENNAELEKEMAAFGPPSTVIDPLAEDDEGEDEGKKSGKENEGGK